MTFTIDRYTDGTWLCLERAPGDTTPIRLALFPDEDAVKLFVEADSKRRMFTHAMGGMGI